MRLKLTDLTDFSVTKQLDHDQNLRTNVVLVWTGTNMYALHDPAPWAPLIRCLGP
jgi:hypothetical protein